MPQISVGRFALLAAIGLAVFFSDLGAAQLWDRDEPRNARASHEMLARGDWIVPTFNDELRDHKPILLYWGQMAAYLALGESEFSARVPSALAALLSILSVAILASRLSGRKKGIGADGFWAAAALATCLLFVMAGRAATPDALLIAFSTLGISALVIATLEPHSPYSSGRVGRARWIPAMFGYTMLSLAALAKGPVGIVLPLAVVHLWWLMCHRLQNRGNPSSGFGTLRGFVTELWATLNPVQCFRASWSLRVLPGMFVCLLGAVPWYAAVGVQTQGAFLRGFFIDHNVGRAMNSMEGHQGSVLFYPVALLIGTFPWSMWLIPIGLWARKRYSSCVVSRQMVVLAITWVAVYVGAFTMASTKLPSYITPCYAGIALLIGGFLKNFESSWEMPSVNWRRAAHALTVLVGIAIGSGLLWLGSHEQMPLLGKTALAGLVIALVGCLGFVWETQRSLQWVPMTWLVGAGAFQVMLFGVGAKSVATYRTDLQVLAKVAEQSPSENWMSVGGLEPSWVHYLNQTIQEVATDSSEKETRQAVQQFLSRYPDGRIIVAGEQHDAMLAQWRENGELKVRVESLGQGKRFLRPGKLTIYALKALSPSVEQPAETAEMDWDSVHDRQPMKVPARSVSHVSDRLNPTARLSEPHNTMRASQTQPISDGPQESRPYNPLRPIPKTP